MIRERWSAPVLSASRPIPSSPAIAAIAAIASICGGHGVEITGEDVFAAYDLAHSAALRTGSPARLKAQVAALCDQPHAAAQWVHGLLASELLGA